MHQVVDSLPPMLRILVAIFVACGSACLYAQEEQVQERRLRELEDSAEAEVRLTGAEIIRRRSHVYSIRLAGPRFNDTRPPHKVWNGDLAAFAVLQDFGQLKDLTLSHASLSDEGLAGLPVLHGLSVLTLKSDAITDKGITSLKDKVSGLSELTISSASVTDKSIPIVAETFNLKCLRLYGKRITGKGLAALERHKELDHLVLSHTSLNDDGASELSSLKSVTTLNLSFTAITQRSFSSLKQMPSLRRLRLSNTRIDKKDLESLADELPSVTVDY